LAISAWQPFDRSLETMLAILDDPGADLRAYATALDRLADAPEAVADALHDSDINAVLASCTFCGKRSRQVRRLIAGPEVLTCDQCVSTCVTVLDDELSSGWRERHDSA
jgi:ATP-dependent protease Clp, ATPase subunit